MSAAVLTQVRIAFYIEIIVGAVRLATIRLAALKSQASSVHCQPVSIKRSTVGTLPRRISESRKFSTELAELRNLFPHRVKNQPTGNQQTEALAKEFKVCKVNVDTNQELAAHYGISSIPTLLIFKDGQIADRHVGVTPETTLRAEMQKLSER
jgi:thiol-disulfide isomerase/thioredoxin